MAQAKVGVGLQATLDFWRDYIKLDELKARMDKQTIEFDARKQQSKTARKVLNDITKDFKKGTMEEKEEKISPLLKAYQEEVNQLTLRSNTAETCFIEVYKLLCSAPDPSPFLCQLSDQDSKLSSLKRELAEAKEKIAEYDQEFTTLKNQEYTIRKLERENEEYEAKMQVRVLEMEQQSKEQFAASSCEMKKLMRDEQLAHQARLEAAKMDLTKLLTANQRAQTQLLHVSELKERDIAANEYEEEMMHNETESLKQALASSRRENEDLKRALRERPLLDRTSESDLDSELDQTRNLLQVTQESSTRQILDLKRKEEEYLRELNTLRSELQDLKIANAGLQEKVNAAPSSKAFEELKQQLKLLQKMEFNLEDDDETHHTAESIMLTKNRRLEAQLTALQLEVGTMAKTLEELNTEIAQKNDKIQQLGALVYKLESGLAAATQNTRATTNKVVDSKGSLEDLLGESGPSQVVVTLEQPILADSTQAVLQSVCDQRDRYRAALEDSDRCKAALLHSRNELGAQANMLKADNLSLYEALRYERTYINHSRKGGATSFDTAGVEEKYSNLYEEQRGDPFKEFRAQQKTQRYHNLPTSEKITLTVGKFVFRKKSARSLVFFYSVILHGLVFFTLYERSMAKC